MYDNGFSDRLIRATQPTEKRNRDTREKELQNVYEKCRQNSEFSFGEYIRCKISRDTLRKCGISNIDLRYIELPAESQLYHGGTSWSPGKPYLFTGSIDRLANASQVGRNLEDENEVECVRLFQVDKDRHLVSVNRSAIEELCREWYDLAHPPEQERKVSFEDTPIITINGHSSTNGESGEADVKNETKDTINESENKKDEKSKDENKADNVKDDKKIDGKPEVKEVNSGTKTDPISGKDDSIEAMQQKIYANGFLSVEKDAKKEPKSKENPALFTRREGLSLVDICFQNERESEFYSVEGVAYEDASTGSSKDILLYHTTASSSISSKDILLFDTSGMRLKQELIVPRRSTKHLVRGQNGYLKCNEPARPRAPPSVRARPVSASRIGTAETSTRDTKL